MTSTGIKLTLESEKVVNMKIVQNVSNKVRFSIAYLSNTILPPSDAIENVRLKPPRVIKPKRI